MNEREYNDKSLTDYLLGKLPNERAEQFDEWSFIDDEFSEALKIAENNLIDAYLHRELDGDTLIRFETYYLSSPLRRQKVLFAESLQTYARQNTVSSSSTAENSRISVTERKKGFLAGLRIFTNPGFALAAFCLLLAAAIGLWIAIRYSLPNGEIVAVQETPSASNLNENKSAAVVQETIENENLPAVNQKETPKKSPAVEPSRPPKTERTLTPPKPLVASFILAPPLRGTPQLKTLSFPRETAVIMMTLKSENDDYKTYQVTLVDESDKKLRRIGNVRITNGVINVSFPADLLKSGIYQMVVAGVKDDGNSEIISNYPFRAAPK